MFAPIFSPRPRGLSILGHMRRTAPVQGRWRNGLYRSIRSEIVLNALDGPLVIASSSRLNPQLLYPCAEVRLLNEAVK
jgi:hypothetical protein